MKASHRSIKLLSGVVASFMTDAASMESSTQPPLLQRTSSTLSSSFIIGESALVDKETGRIFWEGGVSNTLTATVGPKVRNWLKLHHFKSTVLSSILLLAGVRALAVSLLSTPAIMTTAASLILQHTILRLPCFDAWFLWTVAILYWVESYFCSTRRYLTNCMTSSDALEAYLETLRQVPPRIEWKVRTFHYEIIAPAAAAFLVGSWQNVTAFQRGKEEQDSLMEVKETATQTQAQLPAWLKQKKVTNCAVGSFQYQHCVDKTVAGVWNRAKGYYHDTAHAAPLLKITLSKLLVLTNSQTRKDYFQQQAAFVAEHCQTDSLAEFSTNIVIPGFKPRLLAVRSHENRSFRFMSLAWFWFFTFLGLSAPYRFWLDDQCDELRVSVIKETSTTSAELKNGVSLKKTGAWFWSRHSMNGSNDNDESNEFRMRMKELQLYASQPMSSLSNSTGNETHDIEIIRNDALQDVKEAAESVELIAEQETSPGPE